MGEMSGMDCSLFKENPGIPDDIYSTSFLVFPPMKNIMCVIKSEIRFLMHT